jgi:hypothetical protein
MRLLLTALGLLTSSVALAQEGPGGPKIFEELDTLTSSTATAAVQPETRAPPKQPLGKRRGILGINVVNLGGFARVKSLKPGGPADRAGLKKWDTLIKIDGKNIRDRRDYVFVMSGKLAGEQVKVEWKSEDGWLKTAVVVLEGGRRIVGDTGEPTVETPRKAKKRLVRRKPKPKTRKWYGWQGLVSDVPSLVVSLVGLITENAVVSGIGLAGYGTGAPMTHFFHENVGRGLISMALRGVVPAGTVLGTIAICDGEARVCDDASPLVVIGALIMFIAIPAVDAAALSWQKLEPPKVETSVKISLGPAVAPRDDGGATFGLAGQF